MKTDQLNDNLVEQQTQRQDPFYQQYLKDHTSKTNRRLHMIGIGLAVLILFHAILTFDIFELIYVPIFGFGFAWVGHYFIQMNKPYTDRDGIIYSVKVNLMMIRDIVMKKRSF